jgi:DNA-binding NarL/FixJ family response regulator
MVISIDCGGELRQVERHSSTHLRAVVAGDTPEITAQVTEFLEQNYCFEVVATPRDGVEAISATRICDPDLVLLDIGIAGIGALAAATIIKEIVPSARVLILSSDDAIEAAITALDSGADAVISKTELLEDLRVHLPLLFSVKDLRIHLDNKKRKAASADDEASSELPTPLARNRHTTKEKRHGSRS